MNDHIVIKRKKLKKEKYVEKLQFKNNVNTRYTSIHYKKCYDTL